ncbi:hypothetical protein AKO1_004277 [Acrasis kona]|uniref:Uncharacterized protein n=1 Tax=Acrasis kona TaxID=1008807 RepID=A0AAW2YHA8_9EUKA
MKKQHAFMALLVLLLMIAWIDANPLADPHDPSCPVEERLSAALEKLKCMKRDYKDIHKSAKRLSHEKNDMIKLINALKKEIEVQKAVKIAFELVPEHAHKRLRFNIKFTKKEVHKTAKATNKCMIATRKAKRQYRRVSRFAWKFGVKKAKHAFRHVNKKIKSARRLCKKAHKRSIIARRMSLELPHNLSRVIQKLIRAYGIRIERYINKLKPGRSYCLADRYARRRVGRKLTDAIRTGNAKLAKHLSLEYRRITAGINRCVRHAKYKY